ncbi:MAG: hypothetical protein R2809_12140 [Flavobacteriales bacterium]
MNKWYFISLLFLLSSCDDESGRNAYFVSGYYRADVKRASAEYFQMSEDGNIIHDEEAIVSLIFDGANIEMVNTIANTYEVNAENFILSNNHIDVEINSGIKLYSSAEVPPPLTILDSGNTTISIDPGQPGEEVFDLSWSQLQGYSFLARLECTEENPLEIPFASGGGFFETTFERPFVESGMLIYSSDFKFYGAHKLTVFVIENRYADLFFIRNGSLGFITVEGPDNVQNGKGFWTAVNAYEMDLLVQ